MVRIPTEPSRYRVSVWRELRQQSLEQLRRWHRDIKARDVFRGPVWAEADQQLRHCADPLAD
ncbi:MAG: hypothetical protein P4L86_19345 [Mycobacterium sp.]|nr:hypothetical protein [Mycobacterium sp.]